MKYFHLRFILNVNEFNYIFTELLIGTKKKKFKKARDFFEFFLQQILPFGYFLSAIAYKIDSRIHQTA